MKARALGVAVLLICAPCQASATDAISLSVKVAGAVNASSVELQSEHDAQLVALTPSGGAFSVQVERPQSSQGGTPALVQPYRLVASWPDGREQLFLGFRPTGPDRLDVTVFRAGTASDYAELERIDQLASDFLSTLEKYFRSRAFHRQWRFQKAQPNHEAALRSARIWFDAATSLATKAGSYFRMDSDIEALMLQYEALAATDRRFAARYRKYARSGYVQEMLGQAAASPFRQIGAVGDLVRERQFDAAQALNESALSILSNAPEEIRSAVAKNQGVTVGLLRDNAAFIQARRGRL